MKVFRGQAKNLRKNIKQNNVKPLIIVFGILVMMTLTYKASNGVIGVGNTMFKEGNGKGRRRRQGFAGEEGLHEPGHDDEGGSGFEGGRKYRTGFQEGSDDCDGLECDTFKGGRVAAYEGMTSCAKGAAPFQGFRGNHRQGFRGNRRQGFKGRGIRRREGSADGGSVVVTSGGGKDGKNIKGDDATTDQTQDSTLVDDKSKVPEAKTDGAFRGSRFGRRRR